MSYVYVYERLGVPLYVGVGSDANYGRARDIRVGHSDFYTWCREKFGGVGRVKVRIIIDDVSRTRALLIESVLITEHARYHDIFNRVVSTATMTDKYVAKYRKKSRHTTKESRATALVASQKRANERRKSSTLGKRADALRKVYMKTDHGLRYFRLSNQISYNRLNGKEFTALEKKRTTTLTLAQWKLTSDGQRALRTVTRMFPDE